MKLKSNMTQKKKWAWGRGLYNASRADYSSLDSSKKAWLQALNESLRQIESKYSAIMNAKCNELRAGLRIHQTG